MLLVERISAGAAAGLMNDRFSADDLPREQSSACRSGPWPIDLARARPFRIGDVAVRPATRELVRGDMREVLEPLVMQVLIALASARGEILSRDDLIKTCWGGRAISDDAVSRVISALRTHGRSFGSFQVVTITKVGYRLVEQAEDDSARSLSELTLEPNAFAIDRRRLLAVGTVVATLGTAAILWQRPWRHRPPEEALDLFQRGKIAQRMGTAEQTRQALSYYRGAVHVDPRFAEAWGALALASTHLLEGFAEAELDSVPGDVRSAARRALEIDPSNADAQLALILIKPEFRNWSRMEAELRGLISRYPQHWLANGRLAVLLYSVGRLNEGIAIHQKVFAEIDAMLPVGQGYLAKSLSFAGRTQEADGVFEEALRRWPAHPTLWHSNYTHLLFSGRPRSAMAFVMDPDSRPTGVTQAQIEPLLRLARAVDTRQSSDLAIALEDWRQAGLKKNATRIVPTPATIFALLGRPDLTFQSLERYYLNRGPFGSPAPIGPYTRRYTDLLFSQPIAPLRSDPRFASLVQRIGLEAYWREANVLPDYRRHAA